MPEASSEALVALRRHDRVVELVLNRPRQMNAISTAMASAIATTAAVVAGDDDVRAVAVTSTSERAFSVGADLKERSQMADDAIAAQRPRFRAAFRSIFDLPMPTIAAVSGYALGGGFEIALSCDLIAADDSAEFALPEVTVGLVPGGGGTQLLLRRVGPAVAADLILTGRRVAIAEAVRLGLVDRHVGSSDVREAALVLAAAIAENSPLATREAKRAMRLGAGVPVEEGFEAEDAAWHRVAFSEHRREGVAAFAEKRRPNWPPLAPP